MNLAQILLRVPENADSGRIDETRRRAEDLLAQLKGGADFARLAASYSNAAEALQGGDLGWRNVDRLPTLFIDATRNVKTGDVSGIVRSPNGFHILKVLGRRSAVDAKLASGPVQQTHARHILLRVSDLTPEPEVIRRLQEFKGRIEAGQVECQVALPLVADCGGAMAGREGFGDVVGAEPDQGRAAGRRFGEESAFAGPGER